MKKTAMHILRLIVFAGLLFVFAGVSYAENERLVLPEGLHLIEEEAFLGTSYLHTVVLPEGTERVGSRAFAQSSVKRIYLPQSIDMIADDAFEKCTGLTAVTALGSYAETYGLEHGLLMEYTDLQHHISEGSAVIDGYDADESKTIIALPNQIGGYPVTAIGAYTFSNCSHLADIQFPDSIVHLGDYAFFDCRQLTQISFPQKLQSIGKHAFNNCTGLTEVEIPADVTSIADYAFAYCSSLNSVKLPSGLTSIGRGVFSNCADSLVIYGQAGSLAETYANANGIPFHATVETMTLEITAQPESLTIGENRTASFYVDAVGDGVQYQWYEAAAGDDEFVKADAQGEEYFFTAEAALDGMRIYCVVTDERGNSLPSDIVQLHVIPGFEYSIIDDECIITLYTGYAAQVEVPAQFEGKPVVGIGESAFANISGMIGITLPETLTDIGSCAFSGCSGLAAVEFPESLINIADDAFSGCVRLTIRARAGSIGEVYAQKHQIKLSYLDSPAEDFVFSISEGVCTIVKYQGSDATVVVPARMDNCAVTAIGPSAFASCDGMTRVILPEGLLSIGSSAFSNCDALISVQLPDTLAVLGDRVFYGCYALPSITLPAGINTVGSELFFHCRNLKNVTLHCEIGEIPKSMFNQCSELERIQLPSSVTSIADQAFQNCYMLKEIGFPSGLTSIGSYAFNSCRELLDVHLPDTVQTIGSYAFANCERLVRIELPGSLKEIGNYAFRYCGRLYCVTIPSSVQTIGSSAFYSCASNLTIQGEEGSYAQTYAKQKWLSFRALGETDQGILLSGDYQYVIENGMCTILDYTGMENNVIVPQSINGFAVTKIGSYAFENTVEEIESIELPNGLTTIDAYAFYRCGFETVRLPDSVTTIHRSAFSGCSIVSINYPISLKTITGVGVNDNSFFNDTEMTSIVVPEGVTELAEGAFCRCYQLQEVILPSTLEKIGKYAFLLCENLNEIKIPDGVKQIDYMAFSGTALEEIVLPASVETTGQSLFADCQELRSATIASNIGGGWTFNGCEKLETVILKEGVSILPNGMFQSCTALESIVLPETISQIGWDVFANCTSLQSINYPASLEDGGSPFEGCVSLTEILIPEGVTTIAGHFFSQLSSVTEIRLPSTVVEIRSGAFVDCYALTSIVLPDGVTTLGAKAFENCPELVSVNIPKAWNKLAGVYTPFYACPKLTTLMLPEGMESIPNYGFSEMESLEQITLPTTLTSIGQYAFEKCIALETIVIPEGVTLIDYGVFYNCSSLRSIQLPDSVATIQPAFSGCDALEQINYPRGLEQAGYQYYNSNFADLPALKKLVVPEGVTALPAGVFGGCDNLIEIQLPQTLQTIGENAFYSCDNLAFLVLPDSVSSIAYNAFSGCDGITEMTIPLSLASDVTALKQLENLRRVVVPEGITTLPAWLQQCQTLTEVVLPSTLTAIDANAFSYCRALTDVQLPDGLKSIGSNAFFYCSGLTEITLPSGITSIGSGAFSYCSGIRSIRIPESLTTLSANLFAGCSALTAVEMHDDIQVINNSVFNGCAMEQLALPQALTVFGSGNLTGPNLKTVIVNAALMNATASMNNQSPFASSKISTLVLAEGTRQIPSHAFRSCTALTEVVLPDTLISIGESVFSGCTALASIYLPDSVETIGRFAFDNCNALTAMNVPASLHSVAAGTYNHPLLTRVAVPAGMTHLPDSIFHSCSGLKAIDLPDGIRSIGANAFYGCSGLEAIRLPNSLESIGASAFYGCSGIKSLTIPSGVFAEGSTVSFGGLTGLTSVKVEEGALELPDRVFSGCSNLRSVILPDSLRHVGCYAFENCTSLASVHLPDEITSLESDVFYGCSSLASVNIPTELNSYAGSYSGLFSGCTSLKTVHVPDGLKQIPMNLFYGSPALEYVLLPESLERINSGAFKNCPNLKAIVLEPDMSDSLFISASSVDISDVRYHAEEGSMAAKKAAAYGVPLSYESYTPQDADEYAALTGAVYANGSAVAGATISIYEGDHTSPVCQTNTAADGSWRVSGLEQGLLYRVECEANQLIFDEYRLYVCRTSHAVPDFTAHTSDVKPELTTRLSGRVLAQDGSAVPGAQILVYRHTSSMLEASTVTDASGLWSVSGLAQGVNYYIRCSAPPFVFAMQSCMTFENDNSLPDFISQNNPKYLLTDLASILGGVEEETYALSVNASSAWTAQTDCDWITLSQHAGDRAAEITISLAENTGVLRTGSIQIRADGAESIVHVTQVGLLGSSLPAPVITCPAADGEVIPFGDLTIAWDQVPQAGWYVVSLRDLTEDVLLLCHRAVSRDAAMQSLLTAENLVPGHEYRVAVGAVPAGENSDSFTVGWSERVFSIPVEVLPQDASLCGLVYAHDYAEETIDASGNVVPAYTYTYPMEGVTVQVYAINGSEKTLVATAVTGEDGSWLVEGCEIGVTYAIELAREATVFTLLRAVPAAVSADVSNASALITTEPGLNDTGTQYGSLHESLAKHYESIWNTKLAGAQNGLFGEYFQFSSKNKAFSDGNKRWENSVKQVDFSWENARKTFVLLRDGTEFNAIKTRTYDGNGSQADLRYLKSKKFAALFTGYIQIPADGIYSFRLTGDDGVELIIETEDGKKYSDKDWNNGSKQEASVEELELFENQLCKLTIRYYNDSGDANLIFEWAVGEDEFLIGDSRTWTTVPGSVLHHTKERVHKASMEAFDVTAELRAINEQITASALANRVGTNLVDKIVGRSFMSAFDLEDAAYASWLGAAGDIVINHALKRVTEVCFEELTKKAFNPDLTAEEIGKDLLNELKAMLPENKHKELDSISFNASKSFGFIIDVLRFMNKHMADEYNTLISCINQKISVSEDLFIDTSEALFGTTDLLDAAEKAMKEFSTVKKLVDFFEDGVEAVEKMHDSDRVRSYIHLRILEDPRGNTDLLENVLTFADGGSTVIQNILHNNPWNTFDSSSLDRAHNDSLCKYFYEFADVDIEELIYKQLLLDTFGFMASGFAY